MFPQPHLLRQTTSHCWLTLLQLYPQAGEKPWWEAKPTPHRSLEKLGSWEIGARNITQGQDILPPWSCILTFWLIFMQRTWPQAQPTSATC